MSEVRMAFCTFPDAETARQIGTALVERQLAACVNLIPGVESVYQWQGKVETAGEVLAIIKTSAGVFPRLEQALSAMHPYEVPEIIAIEPSDMSENYASWLLGCLASGAVSE